jgi:hypothetical protein
LSPSVADEDCLFYFPPVSRTDVIDIVKLCPTKSFSLDPIPSALLKSVIGILATPIALLYNLSVSTGMFPSKPVVHLEFGTPSPSLFALSQLFLPLELNSRLLCLKLFFPRYCIIHLL